MEVLVVRIQITNKSFIPVKVSSKYKRFLHGRTEIPQGRVNVRYPITDERVSRLLTQMEKDYPELDFHAGMSSIEEAE